MLKKLKVEPISTLTNLAYLGVAFSISEAAAPNLLLIASLVGLCASSAAFHYGGSEHNTPAHKADVFAVYLTLAALLCHVWDNNIYLIAAVFTALPAVGMHMKSLNLYRLGGGIAIGVAISLLLKAGTPDAFLPIGLATAAGGVRFLLQPKIKESLTDFVHGAWHILTAAAMYTAWVIL